MGTYTIPTGYLLSGASAEGTGAQIVSAMHRPGFVVWYSGSGNGPTAGGSAIFSVLHSHNGASWTVLSTITGVKGTVGAQWHSAGVYVYLKARVDKCFSAAETGTGSVWVWAECSLP
jgi:hypothetical protein